LYIPKEARISLLLLMTVFIILIFLTSIQQPVAREQTNDNYNLTSLYNQATDLYRQGRYEEAIAYYDKALAIDPNDVDALNYKGAALYRQGKHQEAITYFDKALAIDPNYVPALTYKGIYVYDLERYDEAIAYYDKALAIDPIMFMH
jgi:tetratricopeptide (TPR) repeat protein